MANNDIDNVGAQHLIKVLKGKNQLTEIDIDNNKISGSVLTDLFTILPLRNLNLMKNVLTDEQVAPISKTLSTNLAIQQIFMSHNQMTQEAMTMFASGLEANTRLTDLFFTHNDLQEAGEAGLAFIKSLSNKKDLRSLALNSCNCNGQYLEALQ